MAARAVLTCRPNSHLFQCRSVTLEEPVKFGRSVARARPQPTNAIFDCKVLSRNHALLWYDNGKFYLQDTKSSNGTFVNNQRLSKSSEESPPREVCSGDIVQFGVDVMELNKKVTHGCIVATLQLFLPDGKEAKASSSTALPEKVPYSVQEIYQLNQYIKEAIQREQMIENKLATINKLMASTKDSVDSNWKVLLEEDRLLTRVDILERQLQTSHKTMTDDKLREEVMQLHEDKEKYQTVAKEICWNSRQERMEAMKNLQDVQKNLSNSEEEKSILKDMFDRNCQELKELVEKYEQSEIKSKELVEQMDQSSAQYKEELESLNEKIKEGELLLEDKQQIIDSLLAKMNTENSDKDAVVTTTHNEDITDFSIPGLKFEIMNDHDSMSKGDVEYPNIQIQTLTNQIKSADSERKEILSKLSHLLNLIEDLKAVSNKVQASEFMQELIHKLDVEIRQIRNFSQGEETQMNNAYINVKSEPAENKTENNIDCRSPDGFEKLLEESRTISKTLQADNGVLKKENEILQERVAEFAGQLKTYQERAHSLADANSDLQSRVNFLQSQVESSEKGSLELRQKLETVKESTAINESHIDQLKGEIASLESITKEREETIGRLKAKLGKRDESASVDIACQTVHNLAAVDKDPSTQQDGKTSTLIHRTNGINRIDDLSSQGFEKSEQNMAEKLLQFEEELAIYKTVYNESSLENVTLRQKIADLQSQHKAIHDQSKLMFFCCSFPVLILIVALFLAFNPSLEIWTGTAY